MTPVVTTAKGVTLIGGGEIRPAALSLALSLAPVLVAADSGADTALAAGLLPEAVMGDLDSLSPAGREALNGRLHHIAEQDTTDFEKCLDRIAAPFVLAVGFAGPRMDHALAVLNTLVRKVGPPTIMLAGDDVVMACPAQINAVLPVGKRLSLFPMGPATVTGQGLRWPPGGIGFAPDGRIGTSNEVAGPLSLAVDGPMLLILPACYLSTAIEIAVG